MCVRLCVRVSASVWVCLYCCRTLLADIVNGSTEFSEATVRRVFGQSYGAADSIVALDSGMLQGALEAVGMLGAPTDHIGTHVVWLHTVAHSDNWEAFVHNVFVRLWSLMIVARDRDHDVEALIIVCCKSGVHRSLAAAYLTALAIRLNPDFAGGVELMAVPMVTVGSPDDYCRCHLPDGSRPCEICRQTGWDNSSITEVVSLTVEQAALTARAVIFPGEP